MGEGKLRKSWEKVNPCFCVHWGAGFKEIPLSSGRILGLCTNIQCYCACRVAHKHSSPGHFTWVVNVVYGIQCRVSKVQTVLTNGGGVSCCICCNGTLHFNIMLLAQQDGSCMFNPFNSRPPLPGLITTEGHSHPDVYRRTVYGPNLSGEICRARRANQLCSQNQTCFSIRH